MSSIPKRMISFFAMLSLIFMVSSTSFAQDGLKKSIELYDSGNIDEAEKLLVVFTENNPENAEAAYYMGRISMSKSEFENAVNWLEKSVELDSVNAEYYVRLGNALSRYVDEVNMFRKMSVARRMKAAWEKGTELEPANIDAWYSLMMFNLQAPAIAGGDKDEAAAIAAKIKELDELTGHRAFGELHLANEEYDSAIKEFEHVISFQPDNNNAYLRIGAIYIQTEQYEKALNMYEDLIKEKPDKFFAYYQIGKLAAISGTHLDPAVNALKFYMDQELPENSVPPVWAHYRLGMVLEHKGDIEEAKKEYNKALKLDPEHKEAKEALERLQ